MILLTFITFSFCLTNVMAVFQPLVDHNGNPITPKPYDPPKEHRKEEEEPNNKKPLEKEDELIETTATKETVKEKPPENVSSNSENSESKNPYKWLSMILGKTVKGISQDNSSKPIKPGSEGLETTIGDEKSSDKKNHSEVGVVSDNESFSKAEGEKHGVPDEQSSKTEKTKTMSNPPSPEAKVPGSEQSHVSNVDKREDIVKNQTSEGANSCDKNPYGSTCTYVLLTTSTFYFYHVLRTF